MTDVEVVLAIYEAMAARDVDRLFPLLHTDVVVTQDPALPWGGRHVGHARRLGLSSGERPATVPRTWVSGRAPVGEVEVDGDGDVVIATPGTFAFVARGAAHLFRERTATARMLVICSGKPSDNLV